MHPVITRVIHTLMALSLGDAKTDLRHGNIFEVAKHGNRCAQDKRQRNIESSHPVPYIFREQHE